MILTPLRINYCIHKNQIKNTHEQKNILEINYTSFLKESFEVLMSESYICVDEKPPPSIQLICVICTCRVRAFWLNVPPDEQKPEN